MATWQISAVGLLTCLFAVHQEVSTFNMDCWDYTCINNYCTCRNGKQPDWSVAVFIVFGIGAGLIVLTALCKCYSKACKDPEIDQEETTIHMSTLPPAFAPSVPSAPPQQQILEHGMDPPPYSEVAWKLPNYPPPEGQPPAYDNIALDISEHPVSRPKDHI